MHERLVIIGSGQAGVTLAREIRKLDKQREIVLLTADDGHFYSKPNLSNAFVLNKTPSQLVVTPVDKLREQLGIDIRPHVAAHHLDAQAHVIDTSAGPLDYGQLVLAVGARPIRLPLAGKAADEILSVNTLDDYALFRTRLAGKRSVALIGGGLVGCEFANDLRSAGLDVQLFDIENQLLTGLLPTEAAAFLRRRLEATGIACHLGCRIIGIEHEEGGYRLHDALGRSYHAGLVLSAVGLRPNLTLASAAGLQTGRGILTDRLLQTSNPDIYALGDCAEIAGLVLPYILPIMHGARALAQTLCGKETPVSFPAMPVAIKLPSCPGVVCPPPGEAGQWQESLDGEGVRALFETADATPSGFALLGAATREQRELAGRMPARL